MQKYISQHCYYWLYVIITLFNLACTNYTSVRNLEGSKSIQKIDAVQVNFIGHWLNEGKKELLLKEQINEFEFTNQDIKVYMKFPEDVYFDRRKDNSEFLFNAGAVTAAKPEWDIIRLNNECPRVAKILNDPNWTKKYLVDFSEIPEFRKNTRPELLSDTVKALYGGIIPGPFIDGYNWVLWVNTVVAKKIGIEVKQFDMTFEDFLGYLRATNDYNKSHNDYIIPMYEANNWLTTHTLTEMLYFSEFGNYDEINDGKYSEKKLNAWDKTLHEIERAREFKPVTQDWRKTTWTETVDYPLKGKCLFYLNASWMYNMWLKIDSTKTRDMLPAEMPVFKTSPACYGGYFVTWAVLKNSPHRDQAVKLLMSLNKPDVAEKWARYTKSPTGVKGNLSSVVFGFDKFENYQYMMDHKYGKHKFNVFNTASFVFGKENENVPSYADSVLLSNMTADKAMKEIRKQLRRR